MSVTSPSTILFVSTQSKKKNGTDDFLFPLCSFVDEYDPTIGEFPFFFIFYFIGLLSLTN